MNNIKIFRVFGILTILSLYFLILVGGIVRATGSGMGCPDWPRCFGHYVPPSDLSEVTFKRNHSYSNKVFIIRDGKLYYTNRAFVSKDQFDAKDWTVFEEHGYAEFNATHTWIEAMNRYVGVFVGLFVMGLFVFAWLLYKKHGKSDATFNYRAILWYSFIAFVFVVIQGIIGKYLVATNLKLKLLTLHMLFSYTVLYAVIYVVYNTSKNFFEIAFDTNIYIVLKVTIALVAIQTVLGTQVTANAETLLRSGVSRENIVSDFNTWFYVHRSFSILLVSGIMYLVWLILQRVTDSGIRMLGYACLLCTLVEVLLGMSLNYLGYPKFSQPMHLLMGTVLAGLLLYIFIIYQKRKHYQAS